MWFKGIYSHKTIRSWGFPVNCPFNQSNDQLDSLGTSLAENPSSKHSFVDDSIVRPLSINNMNTNVPHAWLSSYSVIVLSKIQCYQGIACHMTERPHGSHTNWMCGQCPWQSLPKSPKCFQICQHHEWCVCVFWSLGRSNTCPPTVRTSCTGANSCKVNSCSPTRGTRPSSKCWKGWSVALAMNLGSSIPSMKIIIVVIIIIILFHIH